MNGIEFSASYKKKKKKKAAQEEKGRERGKAIWTLTGEEGNY